ncbi:TPA: mobile mystery protein A [Vibrio diabolicus]
MKSFFSLNHKLSNVKAVVRKQIMAKVTEVMSLKVPAAPKAGWIRTIREALDMSGTQLGERLQLTRNQVSILERKEAAGTITLNQLQELAEGLNADLVYAVVPRKSIEETIEERATEIAKSRLKMSHQNMFLEAQQLSKEKQEEAIQMLVQELKSAGGKVLWKKNMLDKSK